MEDTRNMTPQEAAMANLVGQFLKVRSAAEFNRAADGPHLDQDTLAAFTEGSLSEREAKPVVSHLVDCSFCRHVTAELVRLEMAFAETPAPSPAAEAEPRRVSEVLSGLIAKMFGTTDGAVFAHNADDENTEEKAKETDSEDPKS